MDALYFVFEANGSYFSLKKFCGKKSDSKKFGSDNYRMTKCCFVSMWYVLRILWRICVVGLNFLILAIMWAVAGGWILTYYGIFCVGINLIVLQLLRRIKIKKRGVLPLLTDEDIVSPDCCDSRFSGKTVCRTFMGSLFDSVMAVMNLLIYSMFNSLNPVSILFISGLLSQKLLFNKYDKMNNLLEFLNATKENETKIRELEELRNKEKDEDEDEDEDTDENKSDDHDQDQDQDAEHIEEIEVDESKKMENHQSTNEERFQEVGKVNIVKPLIAFILQYFQYCIGIVVISTWYFNDNLRIYPTNATTLSFIIAIYVMFIIAFVLNMSFIVNNIIYLDECESVHFSIKYNNSVNEPQTRGWERERNEKMSNNNNYNNNNNKKIESTNINVEEDGSILLTVKLDMVQKHGVDSLRKEGEFPFKRCFACCDIYQGKRRRILAQIAKEKGGAAAIDNLEKVEVYDKEWARAVFVKDLDECLSIYQMYNFDKSEAENIINSCVDAKTGDAAIHQAVRHKSYELIQFLIDLDKKDDDIKFDMNKKQDGANGNTALHLAAVYRNTEMIKFLIENGADPDIKNKKDKRPQEMVEDAEDVREILNALYPDA